VAQICLTDKVMPVYLDALELAKNLLGEFCQSQELHPDLAKEGVHTLIPIIVAKSSDRNTRSIEGTHKALIFLARQKDVGCSPIMTHMLTPITNLKEVAAIRGRLELISQFITEFGFSKSSGMSLSAVMTFVRPHLEVSVSVTDEKVRRAAVEVTVQCYALKGDRTRKFCANLKPALQKLLEQRFSELDGKGNSKPKKAPGALPELRGSRGSSRGLPRLAINSRGSSRGSVGSLGKNPLDRASSALSIASSQKSTPLQETSDPFSAAAISEPKSDAKEDEDESLINEIESF